MFVIDTSAKTLTITLAQSAVVKVRFNIDEIYSSTGVSHVINLPIKDGMIATGAYVAIIDGVETLLPYSYPTEEPNIVWDENGLLSTMAVGDNTAYLGTIVSQSIVCTPPAPLVEKTGTSSVSYDPNIYSGTWSVRRTLELYYDQGNGLTTKKSIDVTDSHIVYNTNVQALYDAVSVFIQDYIDGCSLCKDSPVFMKLNGYMELFNGYWLNGSYEKAYDTLYEAGKLVNLSSTTVEIEPMMNGIAVHIQNFNNPHKTSFSNIEGYPSTPTNNRFLRDDKTFAEIALKHSQLISPNEDVNVQHLTNSERFEGGLATGVDNPSQFTGKDISTINKLATEFDLEINNKAEEDGTILYHSKPWTTAGSISITGNTVTGTGTAFTSGMVGAKLKTSSGWYAIVIGYENNTNITINKNVIGTLVYANGNWGLYNKGFAIQDGSKYIAAYKYNDGNPSYYVDTNNNFNSTSGYALYNKLQFNNGLKAGNAGNNPPIWLGVTSKITWVGSNVDVELGTKDLGIARNSIGKLEINDGNTAGVYRDLNLRNLNYTGALNNTSDERLKTGFRSFTRAKDKVLKLAECVKHFEYKDQNSYAEGLRTDFIAQLLQENGFEGHVSERMPKDENEGILFGWTYKDEQYEETNEQGEIEIKIRRIVDKQGDMVLQIEKNFIPHLCCAYAELNKEHEELKQRLINIEKSLGLV